MDYHEDDRHTGCALRNQFTAYLVTAVRHARAQYIYSRVKRYQIELLWEEFEYSTIPAEDFVSRIADMEVLFTALRMLQKRERIVFLSRVLEDKSFEAIAAELGVGYKGVAAIYYRTLAKLRRILGGETNEF